MDILTHAVMGASLAAGVASFRYRGEKLCLWLSRRRYPLRTALAGRRRLAAGIGAVAGILPDADILIQSGDDALLVLDYHRHFTHALAFVPIGALVAAPACCGRSLRRRSASACCTCPACSATSPIRCSMPAPATAPTSGCRSRNERRSLEPGRGVRSRLFTLLLAVPLYLSCGAGFARRALGPAARRRLPRPQRVQQQRAEPRRWRWRRRAATSRRSSRSSRRWPTWCCGAGCTCP
jgi:hypothetical protein